MASSARSSACAPPAWKAITNACPLVCCTAFASSKTRPCSRVRTSRQTPVRPSGPASRQARMPRRAAAISSSTAACGGRHPRVGHRRGRSRTASARSPRCRRCPASPAGTSRRARRRTPPCPRRRRSRRTPAATGDSSKAEWKVREAHAATAWSRRSRCAARRSAGLVAGADGVVTSVVMRAASTPAPRCATPVGLPSRHGLAGTRGDGAVRRSRARRRRPAGRG